MTCVVGSDRELLRDCETLLQLDVAGALEARLDHLEAVVLHLQKHFNALRDKDKDKINSMDSYAFI